MAADIYVLRIAGKRISGQLNIPQRVRLVEMTPEEAANLVSGEDPFSGKVWQARRAAGAGTAAGSPNNKSGRSGNSAGRPGQAAPGGMEPPQGTGVPGRSVKGRPVQMSADVLLLDSELSEEGAKALTDVAAAYRVFYTRESLREDAVTDRFLRRKMAAFIAPENLENFLRSAPGSYWKGQYGNQLTTSQMEINPYFRGLVTYRGHSAVELSGSFGRQERPVACWRRSIPMNYPDKSIDFWPEIHTEGRVRARFRVAGFSGQEGDLPQKVWEFDSGIREPFHFIKTDNLQLSVELLAEGNGLLRIGPLHYRDSRNGAGYLLPGGERYCDVHGEELFAYYDPGDGAGPLNVCFCEGNGQERFHGLRLMQTFGAPVLMLLDTRLSSGKYYVGSPEYEKMVLSVIRNRMKALGLGPESVILSGTSSGAYGALYYGCSLHPGAIVLGKPLLNPGSVAVGERLRHPGTYGESLDVLLDLTGRVSSESAEQLDRKLWDRLDLTDFGKTRFAAVYMTEDDLDPTGYSDLLSHLERKQVLVYGKGVEGRHEDNREQERQWFYLIYRKILMEEFDRDPGMAM